jgi:hypothetical protein
VRKQVCGFGLGEQRVEPQHKGILVPEEVEVSNEHCWVDAHGYTQDLVVVVVLAKLDDRGATSLLFVDCAAVPVTRALAAASSLVKLRGLFTVSHSPDAERFSTDNPLYKQ